MPKKGERPQVILDDYTLRILSQLQKSDLPITELCKKAKLSYNNTLIKRLDHLEEQRIIKQEKQYIPEGKQIVIKLKPKFKSVNLSKLKSIKKILECLYSSTKNS